MDNRKNPRRHLIMYLRVYDLGSGELLGHLGDITEDGMMLVSEKPIESDKMFELRMLLPQENEKESFSFQAQSLWSKNDINPRFYDTGFRFIDPTQADYAFIRELTAELGFREPT